MTSIGNYNNVVSYVQKIPLVPKKQEHRAITKTASSFDEGR